MAGKLYIVATPIGNLEDMTFRAVRILKEVDMILAEDTRKTVNLLNHYSILPPLFTYHQHSWQMKKDFILNELIKGKNLALVTDAGTPGISDPGNELIDYIYTQMSSSKLLEGPEDPVRVSAADNLIEIIPIPGPSSLTAALSVSGLRVTSFVFLGFFPRKKRQKLFAWLRDGEISFAFFESPHRLVKSLQDVGEYFGTTNRVVVARELTKLHETLYRGSLTEVLDKLKKVTIKGEVVVVVEASSSSVPPVGVEPTSHP